MQRYFTAVAMAALVLVPAMTAKADWWHRPKSDFCSAYEHNKIWPLQFVHADRQAATAPFQTMIAKGWQRQNTLGDYHFDDANQLTEAGRLKVRWILTDPALDRRQVFVHGAMSREVTTTRVSSVQQFLAFSQTGNEMGSVAETNLASPSYPADYVDEIGRKFRESIPLPRLPEREKLNLN